jgi:Iron-containing alcohol dehydrogenase
VTGALLCSVLFCAAFDLHSYSYLDLMTHPLSSPSLCITLTAHYAKWAAAVKDLMARPRTAIRYATRFPAPLYWHRNSFLTHPGPEGDEESGGADGEEGSSRGLSTVSGNTFGFLSPKISMGRGIAVSAVRAALTDLKIKKPFIVTGSGGFNRLKDSLFIPAGAVSTSTGVDYPGLFCISGEPTVEDAKEATARALAAGCDGVLSVGEC